MKSYLKYKLQKNNMYNREFSSEVYLDILANFLECEANPAINSYLEWAKNTSAKSNNGNLMFIEKINDTVAIGYIPEIIEDTEEKLIIPTKNFIQILEDWQHLRKKRPQEIWIIKDGNRITLEAKD